MTDTTDEPPVSASASLSASAPRSAPAPGPGAPRHALLVCRHGETDRAMIRRAVDWATAVGASLSVLGVRDLPGDLDRIARSTGSGRVDLENRLLADHRATLEVAVAEAVPGEARPDVHVRVGKPFLEIIRHVQAQGHDLVIKTADDTGGLSRYLFASTDQHLLRKCPAAVWLQRRDQPLSVRRLLVAVDVDEAMASEPDTLAGLNRRLLDLAVGITDATTEAIHVVHVWDAPGEGLVRLWTNAPDPDRAAEAYVSEVQGAHGRALDQLVADARAGLPTEQAASLPLTARLERGVVRQALPALVDSLSVDLLVMGTVARTGVPGLLIGNTAEDILNATDCSVLTAKPPGFVSPIGV
ncbi:hypothetical protein CCR80_03470 [Rhodothalassium salexigens]|uniref:universal stress protein n=1 Tax=Rhodothalassium salexigens TaxID=1086 RepID=UPI00237C2706|nr:universal stress protein [Rhodothalassium salexigens]MBK5920099.1 hypothetical protein [Rhodothalassium salexigens]